LSSIGGWGGPPERPGGGPSSRRQRGTGAVAARWMLGELDRWRDAFAR
jgi:hypothetical protein